MDSVEDRIFDFLDTVVTMVWEDDKLLWGMIIVVTIVIATILDFIVSMQREWEEAKKRKKHVYKIGVEQSKPVPPRPKDYSFANLRKKDIYIPDTAKYERPDVKQVSMTSKEAVDAGFSFRKLPGRIRITGYHGNQDHVLIPSEIAGLPVREIRQGAFRGNQNVRQIEIPDSVKKLGEAAFEESHIRVCIMGNGITYIPSRTFQNCTALKSITLPSHLTSIGNWAFRMCHSLWYIAFPTSCRSIGAYAFEHSAIEGFSIEDTEHALDGGSAFCATPLAARYKIIRANRRTDRLDVMQCCVRSGIISFPEKPVHFGKNTLSRTFSLILDCSKCEALYAHPLALPYAEAGCISIKVIMPVKQMQPPAFPSYVTVCDKWNIRKETVQSEHDLLLDTAYIKTSPVYKGDISAGTKELIIRYDGDVLYLRRHAVFGERLENVTITTKLKLIAYGELFSPDCRALRQVSWNEGTRYITKYIPPAELIGDTVHQTLLHAFRSRKQPMTQFFDSRIIDRLFREECFADKPGSIPLSQKQRILIAVDVLRSTQRSCDSDTTMYRRYLETHRRYAKIVCERIADRFPEYQKFLQKL